MAEEQTQTNVKQEDGMYHYYISTATRGGDITCQAFITDKKLESNLYPIVVTPIDSSLENPVFNWTTQTWVEVDAATLNAKIASVIEDVQALTKSNQEATKENAQITKTLDGLNANMGALTSMMSMISSKLTPSASSATTTEGGQN